jgi:alpha-L-fucosidase
MKLIRIAALISIALSMGAAQAQKPETRAQRDARMGWWREARFGMFIHWGLYAIPAGVWNGREVGGAAEWIMNSARIPVAEYKPLQGQFNPVKFDADAWVRIAKRAGMKYIVITSKHHDGFCLWPSAETDWTVANTPYGRDILAQLSAACRKYGLRFATYHSIMDWTHPDYLPRRPWDPRPGVQADFDNYRRYLKAQLKEIITNYDPAILWFDGEWEDTWTHEMGVDLYRYVRGLKPDIIVNNRVDKGRGGMGGLSDEQNVGDYGTPEQEIPANGLPGVDWESCMTMNNTWGYSRLDHDWKSATTLIRNLIDCASKGGNYLLNVGPTADGYIPAESIERLNEVGRWMDKNAESIYGTVASPFPKPMPWGAVTQKPGRLYLHVWKPQNGAIVLPGLLNRTGQASLLSDPRIRLRTSRVPGGIRVEVPQPLPDSSATVIVLPVEGKPRVAPPSPLEPDAAGAITLSAVDATAVPPARFEEPKQAIGYWTDPKATVSWTVRFPKPGRYTVSIEQAVAPDTAGAEFAVEVAGATIPGRCRATGGWEDFVTVDLGEIEIPRAGLHTVTVRPVAMPGYAVMNLRSLCLKPAG